MTAKCTWSDILSEWMADYERRLVAYDMQMIQIYGLAEGETDEMELEQLQFGNSNRTEGDRKQAAHDQLEPFIAELRELCGKHGIILYTEYTSPLYILNADTGSDIGQLLSAQEGSANWAVVL